MGAELEGFGYVLGKIYNCNKETVLSMEDTLDVLPDGEDAEWFALMLRYTGLRVVVTESGSRLNKNWYMYANLMAPDGSFACPTDFITAYIGYSVEECVRKLVRKCCEFNGGSFGCETFPDRGSRRFECPPSMSELRMKLELKGETV